MHLTKPLLLTLSLSLSACLSTIGSTPTNQKPSNQSSALDYLGSDTFDNQLSGAMKRADADIQVSFLNPFFPDNLPERIETWLKVIEGTGGKIGTAPAEGERDIVNIAIALYSVYQAISQQLKYLPAKNYNATLLYRRNNAGETRINIFRCYPFFWDSIC